MVGAGAPIFVDNFSRTSVGRDARFFLGFFAFCCFLGWSGRKAGSGVNTVVSRGVNVMRNGTKWLNGYGTCEVEVGDVRETSRQAFVLQFKNADNSIAAFSVYHAACLFRTGIVAQAKRAKRVAGAANISRKAGDSGQPHYPAQAS